MSADEWRKASSLEEAKQLMREIGGGERVWVRPAGAEGWHGWICDAVHEMDIHWNVLLPNSPVGAIELAATTAEERQRADESADRLADAALENLAVSLGHEPDYFRQKPE